MYIPGTTWLHTLDPRAKLLIVVLLSILLFSITSPIMLTVIALLVAAGFLVARIPLRSLRTIVVPILLISLFTLVANTIAWGPVGADATFLGIGISFTGALRGLYFMVRLLALVLVTSLLALTTSPVAMTDAITSILSPLRALHVPVDDIALVFSIALRFIPTIADEAERIVLAQTARGAQFASGNIIARIKAWIPVLVPLLVQLFRRADNLALAMESRCYSGQGRTRLRELTWHRRDTVVITMIIGLCALAWFLSSRGVI
ncbi:MAG: energy-coupling factor transporter transmembrane protein EcfT [Actinomycetia bacterium]|nr:energy-coupling factor transporter transmembrane protein EcfT [Actinomycetes bacterium]